MKYLGIDYGEKRCGLSYGDELGVAVPLRAATQPRKKERFSYLAEIIAERGITDIVVGYPYNMDGTSGFKVKEVEIFIDALKKRFPSLPIHRVDERLTSHQVENDLQHLRQKVGRRSGEIDSRAATLILQDFLNLQV